MSKMGIKERKETNRPSNIPEGAHKRIPEEYRPGDIVYGHNGQKYILISFGEQGYNAIIEYADGPKKGKRNFIREVNWLYK